MKTLFTIHDFDADKVDAVAEEMKSLGNPKIRVVDCSDYYMAIEGVHRIAAAAKLGIPLDLEILDQDTLVASDSLDLQDLVQHEKYTAGEIAGECYSPSCGVYNLDENLVPLYVG